MWLWPNYSLSLSVSVSQFFQSWPGGLVRWALRFPSIWEGPGFFLGDCMELSLWVPYLGRGSPILGLGPLSWAWVPDGFLLVPCCGTSFVLDHSSFVSVPWELFSVRAFMYHIRMACYTNRLSCLMDFHKLNAPICPMSGGRNRTLSAPGCPCCAPF